MTCFVTVTANDNGRLEFSEFCEIIATNKKSLEQEQEELKAAFRHFDKDGSGSIDREELKQVNPLQCKSNYSAASSNMTLVGRPYTGR